MKGLLIQLAIAQSTVDKKVGVDAHIVVGTPGKVVDWLKRRIIDTSTMKVFVLDEADNMVQEGGHRANSLLIKKTMPKTCQSLFFSATFPPEVVQFATKMVDNPDKIPNACEEKEHPSSGSGHERRIQTSRKRSLRLSKENSQR